MAGLSVWSRVVTDPQNGSEDQAVILPRSLTSADGTRVPVLYCHGALNSALQTHDTEATWLLAQRGYPVIGRKLSGDSWGNDTSIARVEQMRVYAQGTLGAKSGKVILAGFSMGGCVALNYARTYPANVAAIVLMCPVLSLKTFHDSNLGGYAASIETAYGGAAAYTAAADAHDPVTFAASLAGTPIKVHTASNDTFAAGITNQAATFVAGVGSSASSVDLGAVGHTQRLTPTVANAAADWAIQYV